MYERPTEKTNFDDIGEFHKKFDLPSVTHDGISPREVPNDLLQFRISFLMEELRELLEACGGRMVQEPIFVLPEDNKIDYVQAFDALLDLVVVAMGTAHLFGFPWQAGWNMVQMANMSKVRAKEDGSDSKRGSGWDIVKPEGWQPPDGMIADLLQKMGWDVK